MLCVRTIGKPGALRLANAVQTEQKHRWPLFKVQYCSYRRGAAWFYKAIAKQ